ncbi:MAG: V-type ATPase subunit [Candidatus Promineifilaceae bacterium]|nr:V-type ATPase subunit [Candidatus Promineifilaceae bacterium]
MLGVLDVPRYAAVNARVRGRIGRLLPPARWRILLNASDSGEFLQYLSGTAYRPVLAAMVMERPDLGEIERRLWQHLAQAYRAPLPFMPGGSKDLLAWLWRRFEVNNLKTILRGVKGGAPPAQIRRTLVPLGSDSELPWKTLTDLASVPVVVERLEGSFYGSALEPGLERYRREELLFPLEIRLDLAYFRQLLRFVEALRGRDRKEAQRFTGVMVDSQNVSWAFRYRIYDDFSPEEILNYTLRKGVRADASVIRQIAAGASVLPTLQNVWGESLPGLRRLVGLPDKQALLEMERIFDRYFYNEATETLKGYSLHLGIVLAYVALQETEVKDLVSVLEGIAANWSPDRIHAYRIAG